MKKVVKIKFVIILIVLCLALWGVFLLYSPAGQPRIEINSVVVRDRVVPLGHLEMRSSLIVGFKIIAGDAELSKSKIEGELFLNGELISTNEIPKLDSRGNNLSFDLVLAKELENPDRLYSIPDGNCLFVIRLLDNTGRVLVEARKTLKRSQIGRRFYGFEKRYARPTFVEEGKEVKVSARGKKSTATETGDYIVFGKNCLQRIYPDTDPKPCERLSSLFAELSRNECKPLTFAIRALRDLGNVKVAVTPLEGTHGNLGVASLTIGAVGQLTEIEGKAKDGDTVRYRWAPKIIKGNEVTINEGQSQRYWLTVRIDSEAIPGDYEGKVVVAPEVGDQTEIPIHVRVLPLTLTDTDVEYGMMMTYAFYELDNRWSDSERRLLESSGSKIYKDLRDHGMTMVYPHSHFYLKTGNNGQMVLDSLDADLRCYKKEGFPGPFCWYLGHLLQTAKPFHPGSILNYDKDVAENRLERLLEIYEKKATECGIPKEKLIVQTVDEPDRKDRVAAGKTLNAIAKEMGFKTLITRPWPEVDIMCTGVPDDDREAEKLRSMENAWWIYPNEALTTQNLAYTRYVFGFGAWRWGVDGVVPWTYQMSQGCNGNPFTVLDGPEVMVTYPGVNGPITTPTWETIRDGINDYKYIFQLNNLISDRKQRGDPRAKEIERELEQFKKGLGRAPGTDEYDYGDWPPEAFEKRRGRIVKWALELTGQ